MALRDPHLLILYIARQLNHLHTVAQRRGHGVPGIRRGDKQHLRQVKGQVEVVVGEGVILLGVKDFEHRRRRVAPVVVAELVNLVEQNDRVGDPSAAQLLDEATGLRADVGAAEAAQFGLIAHAAQAHANEGAPKGAGNALAQASLADAGRADEDQDWLAPRAPAILAEGRAALLDRQILKNALLDLHQTVMILVKHLAGVGDINRLAGVLAPRQLGQPLQIGTHHLVLGRAAIDPTQAPQLAVGLFARHLRQIGRVQLLAQIVEIGGLAIILAQLLLNGAHLLAQIELALLLGGTLLHLLAQPGLDLKHRQLLAVELAHLNQPGDHIKRIEQVKALLKGVIGRVAGVIGQVARILNRAHEVANLLGDTGAQVEDSVNHGAHLGGQMVEGGGALGEIGAAREAKARVRLALRLHAQLGAGETAHNDSAGAAGQHARLLDPAHHSDREELLGEWRLVVGVEPLGGQQHIAPVFQRGLGGSHILGIKGQANRSMGEDDGALKGNQRQGFGCGGRRRLVLIRLAHTGTPR